MSKYTPMTVAQSAATSGEGIWRSGSLRHRMYVRLPLSSAASDSSKLAPQGSINRALEERETQRLSRAHLQQQPLGSRRADSIWRKRAKQDECISRARGC